MYKKIVITGIGLITPIGISWQNTWPNLINGKSGIERITGFDASSYNCQIAGEIKNWPAANYIDMEEIKRIDRLHQFSIVAAKLALEDSGLELKHTSSDRIGVFMGSGLGGLFFAEAGLTKIYQNKTNKLHPLTVPNVNPNAMSTLIAKTWQLLGPNITVCTACASGAHAIGQALYQMRLGKADVLLVGGAETPIMPLTFAGFDALRVMSGQNDKPQKASKPFDKNRDGFVMGEGAGVLVLETEAHARKRKAKVYAELAGYGATNGGYHLVAPNPTGLDAAKAMEEAIIDSKLDKKDINYINAHGTATKANDIIETKAIKTVFKETAPKIPISSTKSMTGHLIGAAGAIEAAFTALSVYKNHLPPTINYQVQDEECNLDYVANKARKKNIKAALSNSFGFGNNNACLVLKNVN